MKTKIILLLAVLFAICGSNLSAQNWDKISKQIKKKQLSLTHEIEYVDYYYNLKKNKNYIDKFFPIIHNDTIFIIDKYGELSSSMLASTIWNKSDTVYCFSNNLGKTYNYKMGRLFTRYMMKLVGEWNIEKIRKEEEINAHMIPQTTNIATRIIFNRKKYKIDCLYFKDFFDIDRDGMDFQY